MIDHRGDEVTAAGLRDESERAAAGLYALGVHEGTVVAWQLPTTREAVVVSCALARLGAVQVPVIPILRHREVSLICRQTGAELLVTPGRWRGFDYEAMAADISAPLRCGQVVVEGRGVPAGDPGSLPAPPTGAGDPVRFVYYSSGTTAEPKGGRHTDATVMATANGVLANMGVDGHDCIPIPFPFTHIGGMVWLTAALHSGARVVLVELFDPETSPGFIARHRPTLLGSALPFFRAYMAAQRRHGDEPLFPSLRAFVGGGAPKPAETHAELKSIFGVGILSGWGLTECAIATASCPDDSDEELATTEGRPSPGVDVRVVGQDGSDLPPGAEGELRVRGPQMIVGYVDSRLDADAFDERGYLRTGDLSVIGPRGHVRITGRLKDIVIRNAENVSVKEVEDALYTHPAVADVAVVGVPDPRTGERACAVVVPRPGWTVTLETLATHCRRLGMANQKIPEQLELADALPRNALGKVLKDELRRRLRA